jgi:hypothetical protein
MHRNLPLRNGEYQQQEFNGLGRKNVVMRDLARSGVPWMDLAFGS